MKEQETVSIEKRATGFESLGYAIIEQAVDDIKGLKAARKINNRGEVTRKWPGSVSYCKSLKSGKRLRRFKPVKIMDWYDRNLKVKQLLHFFRGDALKSLLIMLSSTIDQSTILKQLKI